MQHSVNQIVSGCFRRGEERRGTGQDRTGNTVGIHKLQQIPAVMTFKLGRPLSQPVTFHKIWAVTACVVSTFNHCEYARVHQCAQSVHSYECLYVHVPQRDICTTSTDVYNQQPHRRCVYTPFLWNNFTILQHIPTTVAVHIHFLSTPHPPPTYLPTFQPSTDSLYCSYLCG